MCFNHQVGSVESEIVKTEVFGHLLQLSTVPGGWVFFFVSHVVVVVFFVGLKP